MIKQLHIYNKALCCILAGSLFYSCDYYRYHPYEGRIEGATHLTKTNLKALDRLQLGGKYRFAFISDTQRWYDETDEVVSDINRRGDIDFVIHGGDLTDFGVTDEFVWMRDCLSSLKMPWLTIIGNHDFLGHGEHIYKEIFGDYNYAFTVGHTRFEMLNTVALELDYSTPVPDFTFLEKEIHYLDNVNALYPDSINRTICVMHSRPGDEQFNNNVLLPFERYLQLFPGMEQSNPTSSLSGHGFMPNLNPKTQSNGKRLPSFCLNGHNHRIETLEPYDDGILFYGVCEIKDRSYYVITINEDESYEMEVVNF